MTIKTSIAALAVVSSLVLFFGQSAHAEGFSGPAGMTPPSMGPPPNFNPGNSGPMPGNFIPPRPPAPAFVPPQAPPAPVFMPPQAPRAPAPAFVPPRPPVPDFAPQAQPQPIAQAPAASSSNTYIKGQCTWYVKSKRPDLPNGLGNGGQWVKNAAARGFSTGTTPRVGAVAEQPGHVAYVESVSGSKVTISEMNYGGKAGIVHTRTVAASTFKYIY
jgi:hypothetical protein